MIFSVQKSQALAFRMLSSSSTSSNPGSWVWKIYAYPLDKQEGGNLWDDLNIILHHTPNLVYFRTGSMSGIKASALMTISTSASSNLTTLDCYLDGDSTIAMQLINRFYVLSKLAVEFQEVTKPNFSKIKPWTLPTVRNFTWIYDVETSGDPGAPDISSLHFLASCRFNPVCRMEIAIPRLETTQSSILDPFFNAHKDSALIFVCVWNPFSESSTILSAENTVEFMVDYPPAIAFARDRLPRLISFQDAQTEGYGNIWIILDVLESHGHFERKVTLQIQWEMFSGFTWHKEASISDSEEDQMLVGRLLRYALRLYEIGVIILDENGKGLDDYIRRG
jgi:hypothetical protein